MKSDQHILITIMLGVPLLYWLDLFTVTNVLAMLVWTLLIDVDHVLHFFSVPGKKSLRRMVHEQKRYFKKKIHRLLIFHTLEFNLLILYFGMTNFLGFGDVLLAVFISGALHTLSDQYVYVKHHKALEKHLVVSDIKRAMIGSDEED